jgi:hypothetical protein
LTTPRATLVKAILAASLGVRTSYFSYSPSIQ